MQPIAFSLLLGAACAGRHVNAPVATTGIE
jgi:hypothetical protein